ncbi:MAG: CHASE2 domain-containing protein [Cyanobacteria bacterium J06598_1]
MDKRVTLKLNSGTLCTGFSAILQIGDEGSAPEVEMLGSLPAAPTLNSLYQQWQVAYRHLDMPSRIKANMDGFATNVSIVGDCYELAARLADTFNQWLRSASFRPIQEKLLEQLTPESTIRLILQTPHGIVQRLPWHLWEICDRYPKLEITLSASTYQKASDRTLTPRPQIRILAVIGHSQGLDIQTDQNLLNRLPNAEVKFLTQPDRPTLDEHLWDPQGWDILFFAGHSITKAAKSPRSPKGSKGYLHINETDVLTIEQLKNALRSALTHGLKIVIFNSCDGLGLAQSLADLQISQVLVMREPVPDKVAHAFLKSFLTVFSQGSPLILAVREAREKLQGLETKYPCAAWLPTLYQNPAEIPPTWESLLHPTEPTPRAQSSITVREAAPLAPVSSRLLVHALTVTLLLALRYLGLFQLQEFQAFDQFMRMRPQELPDARLVVVTVTNADVEAQDPEDRRGSLADSALSATLNTLNEMEPRLIGLDIYRDYSARANQPALANALKEQNNLYAVCKGSDQDLTDGISAPPEVPSNRVGFSDFLADTDGIVRRQMYSIAQEPASSCQSAYAIGTLLALDYLATEGVSAAVDSETGALKVGDTSLQPLEENDGGYRNIDDGGYQLLLNYRSLANPEQIADQVTLEQLLSGEVSAEVIRDRIVLIGTKTNGFYADNWLTPYGETRGVFMQAHIISQLLSAVLDDRPLLRYWPEWGESLWILFWAGSGSLMAIALSSDRTHFSRKLALALLASELLLFGGCWLLFSRFYLWVPWVPAAIAPLLVAASTPLTQPLSNRSAPHLSQPTLQ